MNPRRFALIGGIVLMAVGILSLIPNLVGSAETLPALYVQNSYGLFLNYLPMNVLNKALLIVVGAFGIVAANLKFNSLPRSILWSRVVMVAMAIVTVLGLIPQTNTLFGYAPLFGGMIVFNAIWAVLGAYYGFYLTSKVPDSGPATRDFKTTSMSGVR